MSFMKKEPRQQDQRRPYPKRQAQANARTSRPQGSVARPPPGEVNGDTHCVPNPKPKMKNISIDFSKPEFVTIFAGISATQTYRIHLDAIIAFSPYFKTAFTDYAYEEARTKTMKLKDIDEKVFRIFNQWIYDQDYLCTEDAIELGLLEVAKLWTAAKKWKIPTLQNQCMSLLARMIIKDQKPPTQNKDNILHQFLYHAYDTKEETQLKRLAVQKMIRVLPAVVSLKEWAAEFPDGLMMDISEALMRHHQSLPPGSKNPKFVLKDHFVPPEE
ncbi:hypothetical protein N431DRAFT_462383 [Stipitochalara longipes BDJ]|nr:hypothetical protein N431DRAFT_462383 [Stipitochalara longipes BDJ]